MTQRRVHFYNVRLSDRDAWFGATGAALFNGLGMLLEIGMIGNIPGTSAKPAAAGAVAVILLIVLFIRRQRPSVRLASVLYMINTAAVATVLVATNMQFA